MITGTPRKISTVLADDWALVERQMRVSRISVVVFIVVACIGCKSNFLFQIMKDP